MRPWWDFYDVVLAAWGPDPGISDVDFIEPPTAEGSGAAAAGRVTQRWAAVKSRVVV